LFIIIIKYFDEADESIGWLVKDIECLFTIPRFILKYGLSDNFKLVFHRDVLDYQSCEQF